MPDYLTSISFGVGLVGATLGIINTVASLDRNRVKLRVVPMHATVVGPGIKQTFISIEVTNLSSFPVTLEKVGFRYRDSKKEGVPLFAQASDGSKLPRRLESRSSVSIHLPPECLEDHRNIARIRCAFARTACGVSFKGSSSALKSIVAEARKFRPKQ
ncbi:MAG: hypothetical protein AB7O62_22675 [Pirellulales bacterium]